MSEGWEIIKPQVNAEAEFFEISNDFGDPLELLREAISNAFDAQASWVKIEVDVDESDGPKRLVIKISDDGNGMTKEVLSRDFWGLGFSQSRDKKGTIGEKGHGTKIYLRSDNVSVKTQGPEGAFFSECEKPLMALSRKKIHEPRIKTIDKFLSDTDCGTEIKITGYNDNQRAKFTQGIVKDYLFWFTKLGSVERVFGKDDYADFKVFLKCLDCSSFEEISFGHPFPNEDSDINRIFNEKGASAADWYVKRYIWREHRLIQHPEVLFDAVISVEGDAVKKKYNPMIGKRSRSDTGKYRSQDRYGIWLCKDFVPIARVNDWIPGFGSGSSSFILLHGFVNCQSLRLTANRGDIANTDPKILEELKLTIQELIEKVDIDLSNQGIYTLRGWQEESRTLIQEKAEFGRRVKNLKNRKIAKLDNCLLVEPSNESELFGVFMTLYSLRPQLFDFEPLDYNTNKGIDVIARNKSSNSITEGEHSYIELKHTLQRNKFNHAFDYLRWIVCWDFDKSVVSGVELHGIEDTDSRILETADDEEGNSRYFLNNRLRHSKIQIIRLKEFIKQKLNLEFEIQKGIKS